VWGGACRGYGQGAVGSLGGYGEGSEIKKKITIYKYLFFKLAIIPFFYHISPFLL